MTLPPVLVLTDRSACAGGDLIALVQAAVTGGAECVLLREKDLPRPDRAALAARLRGEVERLLVASDPTIDADGVHLSGIDPMPAERERPVIVGRSCHSGADLIAAAEEGCDYATLSPIFPSASKPGYGPALGVAALGDAPLPVYALGGVDPTRVTACVEAGAAGVAVMGAVMSAPDPVGATRAILAAMAR